ncbi:MAG TPA: MGMT family protein [Bacteroidales bacterium]|nr:MGMT family protein [Bacteroidales bacterium]
MARKKSIENSDFFSRVYDLTKMIPYGKVTSYGAIAHYLGSGRSARMVGWALNSCHSRPEFIPAHRVVNRKGMLTGKRHFGNSTTMQQLLENEGILVENDQVLQFAEKFWDPGKEL